VTTLKGNHLISFGGTYQRNWNYHQRTDNGGGINYQTVYQLGTTSNAGISMTGFVPAGLSSSQTTNWGRDYAAVTGIVSIAQIAYTRSGPTLQLNPPNTPASDKSTVPYYNVYVSDTWKIRPTLTLSYGLGWTLEMPPTEEEGKQIMLVDSSNQPIDSKAYFASRERAALQGQVFNPDVGFALIDNTSSGPKYPYNPYYGSFSPRLAAAWSPSIDGDGFMAKLFGRNETVIRAGYGRTFGRLNGVDLVLVPLLGTGLIQPVQCIGALRNGTCAGSATGANPNTAFRIGTDGNTAPLPSALPTLPQPLYPGINGVAAGQGEALDPNFRPNVVDSVTFTVQRQINNKMVMEFGYIGRWIDHEYMPLNINSVPYMMTLGGQRFDKAYANIAVALGCDQNTNACGAAVPPKTLTGGAPNPAYGAYINAIAAQPFFQAAMQPSYCAGTFSNGTGSYANCTAAVIDKQLGNITGQNVWSMWSALDNGGFNFPRTMMNTPIAGTAPCPGSPSTDPACGVNGQLTSGVGVNASIGYGNYNAGFVTFRMNDWKGLTLQSNFTYSKALGTGAEVQATSAATAPDPFNLGYGYGLQGFDRKFVFNVFGVYQPPFYKGQQGIVGHILGGWTIAPVFAAGSALPMTIGTVNGGGQALGEGDSVNVFGYGVSENAIQVRSISGVGVNRTPGELPNLFKDPAAAYDSFRQPILGLDTKQGGFGNFRGLGYWNVDLSIKKNFRVTERLALETQMVVTNLFNHVVFSDPGPGSYLDTSSPSQFGVLPQQGNSPRQMEFGIRVSF
jgi:hypothetical protein